MEDDIFRPRENETVTEPDYTAVDAPIIIEAYSEPDPAKTVRHGRITGIERDADEAVIVDDDEDDDIIPETTIRTVRNVKADTEIAPRWIVPDRYTKKFPSTRTTSFPRSI